MKTVSRNTLITVENPTEDQFKNLPSDAHCPCSRILLSYGDFISIETRFHQICSSDFISDQWIETFDLGLNRSYLCIYDFRREASAVFQALRSFCQLTKNYTIQNIASFNIDSFVSPEVLQESVFQSQINVTIQQFQLSLSTQFVTQLELIRKLITANRFLSGLATNFVQFFRMNDNGDIPIVTLNIILINASYHPCACRLHNDCKMESNIYNIRRQLRINNPPTDEFKLMTIPGMTHSCLSADTILYSTLECFYNESCVEDIVSLLHGNETFTSISEFKGNHYKINSTLQDIINNLMIEEWITNISYENYYRECAPLSCTYFKNNNYDSLFILKQLLSLLGGLTMILSFIIQNIVKLIRRRSSQNPESISPKIKIRRLLTKSLTELNMFKDSGSNEQQIKYQRIATRFDIFIFIISLIILSIYALLIEDTQQRIIHGPSELQFKELDKTYSSDLYCPCSTVSMDYSSFITIKPSFHQVCTSDLISDPWIAYMRGDDTYFDSMPIFQYQNSGVFHFQLLAMFCQYAQQTVDVSIETFLQTRFLSSQVISQNRFEAQINSSINDWKSQTLGQFLQAIEMFLAISKGNQLMSEQFVYYIDRIDSNDTSMNFDVQEFFNCSCVLSSSCFVPILAYHFDPYFPYNLGTYFTVPNFFVGCSHIEGLMKSTLECYYNISCMMEIDRYMYYSLGVNFSFSNLNENYNSPNETIESIINKLMIDSWLTNLNDSFSLYYKICNPQLCSYEYISRNDLFIAITMILGIFGGLSLGLRLLTLITVRFIEKIINNMSFIGFKTMIKDLFVFNTEQRRITRLHFVFMVIALYSVFIFSAFRPKSVSIQISKPSLSTYQVLLKDYSDSLQCSCSQISISYETFLSVESRFHDLCSSEFISNEWINYLYGEGHLSRRFSFDDYRRSAPGQFLLLSSFCKLSQEKVNYATEELFSSNFINSFLLSENDLFEQIQIILHRLHLSASNSFLNIVNLIREIIGSNMIMSAWNTNWKYISVSMFYYNLVALSTPSNYGECNCGLSFKCTQSSGGMMTGCYALESLLQTKLQCFYDQNCIDSSGNFTKLNNATLEKSKFNINSTIELILKNLMIEEYKTNLSYENYFNQCKPLSCSYSYIKTHDVTVTIISIISLYGGLVIITRCLAIIIIKIYQHNKNRINPTFLQSNN